MEEEEKSMSSESKLSELKQRNFQETLTQLHDKASSVLFLTAQGKEIANNFKSLRDMIEEKAKELLSIQESVRERVKQVEKREEEYELKEKELGKIQDLVRQGMDGMEEKRKNLEGVREFVKDKFREIEAREKEMERKGRELEGVKEMVEARIGGIEVKEKESEKLLSELKVKEKKFEEECKEFKLKDDKVVERLKEIELKEKEIRERCKGLELNEKKFEERCKEFNLRELKVEEQCQVLKLKEIQVEQWSKEVELERKRIMEKNKDLELKKEFAQEGKDIGLKDIKSVSTQVKTEPEDSYMVEIATNSMDANLCSVVTIDGKALQLFLNKHCKEHDSKRNEVEVVLRLSSDPAMLVLNALEGFHPPHLKKGDLEFEGSIVRRSCILLLEQLMKISPEIQPHVKKRAINIASDWNKKMRLTAGRSLEVLGFLQLLASYGLASAFNSDKLLKYLWFVSQHRKAPELFRVLGFSDKIPRFIHDLIGRKQQVAAVNFICAFDLINEFPPGPSLLKDYLNNSEIAAKRMCSSNKSLEAQTDTTKKRIADLRAVLRCIEDHKIESELSPEDLKKQIEFWVKENSKRERALSNLDCESQLPNPNEKKCLSPKDAVTEHKSSTNRNTKSTHCSSTVASNATPTEAVAATTAPSPTGLPTKAASPITATAPALPTTITSTSSTVAPTTTTSPATTIAPTSPTIVIEPTSVKPKIEPEHQGGNKRTRSQNHEGMKRPRVMTISEVPPRAYFRDSGYLYSVRPHWQQPAGWFMQGATYLNRAARENAFNAYTSTNLQLNPDTMPYHHMPMPPWRH